MGKILILLPSVTFLLTASVRLARPFVLALLGGFRSRLLLSYNDCLLSTSQSDRLRIILVAPRNPLNIGAAARAMANFGLHDLTIVAPFATNWMEAKSAVGAPELLRGARICATLAEAVADCALVLGTGSLDRRRPEQRILPMPQAAGAVQSFLQSHPADSRVALVFGSEKHGLTSDDLTWCHAIVVIETADEQPSMNLGQAVAVTLYACTLSDTPVQGSLPLPTRMPNSEQLDRLASLVEATMEEANYMTRGLRSANGEALRILLRRLLPEDADLRRIMGLFRRILWRMQHPRTDKNA